MDQIDTAQPSRSARDRGTADDGTDASGTPAGVFQRVAAFGIDFFLAVAAITVVGFAPGLVIPLDRFQLHPFIPGILALSALTYVLGSCSLLSNSYGRYAMGIRVVDVHDGQRPNVFQAMGRMLTVGLWPIELLMIASNDDGRRLGDRLAATRVIRYQAGKALLRRLLPGLMIAGACLVFFVVSGPIIAGRMDIVKAARVHVHSELGVESERYPGFVKIDLNHGEVAMRLADARVVRVQLEFRDAAWRSLRIDEISESDLGSGFSVRTPGGGWHFGG